MPGKPPVVAHGGRARTPVMVDVARLAGVSHQTVSRVLNGHPNVSPRARLQVEDAIAQLGYRRNGAARALVTRQTMTLGVVSVDTSHYGPAGTLFGIEQAAREAGYYVSLATLRTIDRPNMRAALDHLTAAAVDGVVIIAPVVAAVEAVYGVNLDVPFVMVEAGVHSDSNSVVIDQVQGARRATRHLLDLGHTSVLHVRGPHEWHEAEARVRGWQGELAAAHAVAAEALVGDWSAASGYEAGRAIAARDGVTAVFVANDQMALGVLRALAEAGLRVPEQISVVGFDDVPEAAYYPPPLTTVRQDFAEVGRRCITHLLARIEGREPDARPPISPPLVVRASTAPPPP